MYALWLLSGLLLACGPLVVAYLWKANMLSRPWALGLLAVSVPLVFVGVRLLEAFYRFVAE